MNEIHFPKHQCGLYLAHNEHRNYYETAEAWVKGKKDMTWKSDEARSRAIATDEIWVLQWYPRTPVGFNIVAAPTLEEVLQLALEVESE